MTVAKILLIILAILLPPIAVLVHKGVSKPFWIDLILTILLYLPGQIYAVYVVLTE
ncbi:YqaE/Pmp3 family membrane protein [Novosphingopyxis baekryungensis]|uniref:YqaE/Pmp3 family membrane protein n=1 Tax=Novosphingopyxis baekryungensis TaxID=279369 RepID=UPI0003B3EEBA|nr:YqaE/Pmp3 family membrane protein [Novosphingopyxis baekryungensis]